MNIKIATELDRLFHNSPWLLYNEDKLKHAIQSTFRITLEDMSYNHIGELIDKIDNQVLYNYFSKVWQPQTKKFKYSGLKLIDEINILKPDNVIDLGCGYNEFKSKDITHLCMPTCGSFTYAPSNFSDFSDFLFCGITIFFLSRKL